MIPTDDENDDDDDYGDDDEHDDKDQNGHNSANFQVRSHEHCHHPLVLSRSTSMKNFGLIAQKLAEL